MIELPGWLLQLVTVLVPTGGIMGGVLLWRQDKRRAPIEYSTAQVADAVALSGAASGLVKEMREELASTRVRLDAQDAKIAEQRVEIRELRTTTDTLRDDNEELRDRLFRWGVFYDDLADDWATHRTREHPPPAPGK